MDGWREGPITFPPTFKFRVRAWQVWLLQSCVMAASWLLMLLPCAGPSEPSLPLHACVSSNRWAHTCTWGSPSLPLPLSRVWQQQMLGMMRMQVGPLLSHSLHNMDDRRCKGCVEQCMLEVTELTPCYHS